MLINLLALLFISKHHGISAQMRLEVAWTQSFLGEEVDVVDNVLVQVLYLSLSGLQLSLLQLSQVALTLISLIGIRSLLLSAIGSLIIDGPCLNLNIGNVVLNDLIGAAILSVGSFAVLLLLDLFLLQLLHEFVGSIEFEMLKRVLKLFPL